jgi:tRNA pseudouridine synthase 10
MHRVNRKEEYHSNVEFEYSNFENTDMLVTQLVDKITHLADNKDFDTFAIGFSWPKILEEELDELKKTLQYSLITKIEATFDKKVNFDSQGAYFLVDFNKKQVFLRLKSLFVRGNYCKFSRNIAQTTHFCKYCRGHGCTKCTGGLTTQVSVEQILTSYFLPEFAALQLKFHGGGREDVDVLMLGEGRPFVVELLQPEKKVVNLKKLEEKINSGSKEKISVNSLELVEKEEVVNVKNSIHEKVYSLVIACEDKFDLNKIKINEKIMVEQRTPVRVEKRRADLVRKKEITIQKANIINENEFEIEIKTTHGTYVKEFVSGDAGRSVPSISSMLKVSCTCKQLDVLKIC